MGAIYGYYFGDGPDDIPAGVPCSVRLSLVLRLHELQKEEHKKTNPKVWQLGQAFWKGGEALEVGRRGELGRVREAVRLTCCFWR